MKSNANETKIEEFVCNLTVLAVGVPHEQCIDGDRDQNLDHHLPTVLAGPDLDPHFPNLNTECGNSKKPGAEGEVGPEEEDKDGGGDQQEQANSQGLKIFGLVSTSQ